MQTTLLFLIRHNQVLLAMKKRGFGVGRWNGTGGKINPDETAESAAIREAEEEIGVTPQSLEKMAELTFVFPATPDKPAWEQFCHVYVTEKWQGNPVETEEMAPDWFPIANLPFPKMWSDDYLWLPHVLNKQKLTAKFTFDAQENVASHQVTLLSRDTLPAQW